MTTLPVQSMPFGRALLNDHAGAFDMNAPGVPTDSAAVFSAGAGTGAGVRGVRVRAGLPPAPTRG
jgi:hypothetical protein